MSGIAVPDVLALVRAFDPNGDARAAECVRRTVALLEHSDGPFDRTRYTPGHMTASAVVLAPDRRHMLLVYHERLGRWLQPGGHLEPHDSTLEGAARREVAEETGVRLTDAEPCVVSVDVHPIPAAGGEPAHYHHDVVFRLLAADDVLAPPAGARARWCPVGDLARYRVDAPLRRAVATALTPAFRIDEA